MSNADLPLVTIITPTYNRAGYLDETIRSVLTQDYPRIEYLVLDDGSTDNTKSVLARYEGRLVWKSHSNVGEAITVNQGFGMARGEIIAVVNSDDPLLPGAVSTAVQFLGAHPEVLVAYPDWVRIDPHSNQLGQVRVPEYDFAYMVSHHHCLAGPGAFFRRKVLELVRGRDPKYRYVGDFAFWLQAGLHGTFARIPRPLATFREHTDSSTTAARGIAMANEHVGLMREFFAQPSLPRHIRKLRRQALSWAHFVAAISCGGSPGTRLKHSLLFAAWYPPSVLEHWRNTRRSAPAGKSATIHAIGHFFSRLSKGVDTAAGRSE